MVCVRDNNLDSAPLTKGNIYTIVSMDYLMVKVINDSGNLYEYYNDRFVTLESYRESIIDYVLS